MATCGERRLNAAEAVEAESTRAATTAIHAPDTRTILIGILLKGAVGLFGRPGVGLAAVRWGGGSDSANGRGVRRRGSFLRHNIGCHHPVRGCSHSTRIRRDFIIKLQASPDRAGDMTFRQVFGQIKPLPGAT